MSDQKVGLHDTEKISRVSLQWEPMAGSLQTESRDFL